MIFNAYKKLKFLIHSDLRFEKSIKVFRPQGTCDGGNAWIKMENNNINR